MSVQDAVLSFKLFETAFGIFGRVASAQCMNAANYPLLRTIADTERDNYGVGRNPACDNCMAHCEFEGTAVDDAFTHPLKTLTTALRGALLTGPMAADLPVLYRERTRSFLTAVPLAAVKRPHDDSNGRSTASLRS